MKWILAAIMVISALLFAGCTIQQQTTANTALPAIEVESSTVTAAHYAQVYPVAIENGNLMPVDVEINAGDTVEWVNKDTVRYTLMFGQFEERLPIGGTFEYTFTEAGTVRYSAVVVEEDQEDDTPRELQGTVIVN